MLPPKREFTYDITMGMLGFGDFAHDSFWGLIPKVGFRVGRQSRRRDVSPTPRRGGGRLGEDPSRRYRGG